ncbi:hypothetical protein NDI43_20615 [Microcoleus vaginatus GB2-A3]|jgi:hypothetical protein|uniref:hypothetical protein n=1 Tax=Microcoleus vaginatus TaxID=119532 RepID=UPI0016858786|nr:hypothetical protein [Microcoleus sp. FACHB-61]
MKRINTKDFQSFVRSLEGQTIETRAQKKQFTAKVTEGGLEYTPLSTGKPRLHNDKTLNNIFDEFAQSQSFKCKDYIEITRNISYTLALIGMYLKRK